MSAIRRQQLILICWLLLATFLPLVPLPMIPIGFPLA